MSSNKYRKQDSQASGTSHSTQGFTKTQVAQATRLSPREVDDLLGDKSLYSKDELQVASAVSDEMTRLGTDDIQDAIASLHQKSQSPSPEESQFDSDSQPSEPEETGMIGQLGAVVNQYKMQTIQQVMAIQEDVEVFEDKVAEAVAGILISAGRNIDTKVSNKIAVHLRQNPSGLGLVGATLLKQFCLPEPKKATPVSYAELLGTTEATIDLLPSGTGNGQRSGQ